MSRPSRFERLGRWCARHRWWVLGTWLALVVVAAPLALRTSGALRSGGFIRQDLESARAKQVLRDEIGVPEAAVAVVFHSEALTAGSPSFESAAAAAMAKVPAAPYVGVIVSHVLRTGQISADGHTAYDIVYLRLPADDSPLALPGLRAAIVQPSGLEVGLAGGPAFYGDVQAVSEADLRRDRKSTRLNSSHIQKSRMPSSA